ncbi:MAG: nitrilase-related carbon-nitrogen hydrolase, partial [Parvularculaceae bacterium]
MVMVLAVLPAALIATEQTGWKPLYGLAAGMAVILIIGTLRMMTPVGINNEIQIVTVQPNIFQRDKIDPDKQIDNFRKVMAVTAEKFTDGSVTAPTVYVAWPENAVPLLAERPGYLDAIANFLPPNAILLTGSVRRDEIGGKLRYYNSMLVVADVSAKVQSDLPAQAIDAGLFRQRAAIASYDKTHLAPFGEYLPLAGLLRAVGLAQLAPFDEGFTPGTGPQTLDLGATKMAPSICYETVFPGTLYPKWDRPD